jgi:hypothetical protein
MPWENGERLVKPQTHLRIVPQGLVSKALCWPAPSAAGLWRHRGGAWGTPRQEREHSWVLRSRNNVDDEG